MSHVTIQNTRTEKVQVVSTCKKLEIPPSPILDMSYSLSMTQNEGLFPLPIKAGSNMFLNDLIDSSPTFEIVIGEIRSFIRRVMMILCDSNGVDESVLRLKLSSLFPDKNAKLLIDKAIECNIIKRVSVGGVNKVVDRHD